MNSRLLCLAVILFGASLPLPSSAADLSGSSGPLTLSVSSNGVKTVAWPRPLIPALDVNRLDSGFEVNSLGPVAPTSISISPDGYVWTGSNDAPRQFFSLTLEQLDPQALFTANVLNRIAYGPTPDDLERLQQIGPEAYIEEQLAMESAAIANDPIDAYSAVPTNSASVSPSTNWTFVTVTGTVSSSTLYMYLTGVGEVYVDAVQLQRLISVTETNIIDGQPVVTNYTVLGPNVLVNGDFESSPTTGWTVSGNLSQSALSSTVVYSGATSLRMVSTAPGSTQGSSIWQTISPALPNNTRCVLSFAYLPNANSEQLTFRLSGSGLIISAAEAPPSPAWVYATATGRAGSTPALYVYLSGAGETYVDDIKLVAGTVAGAGANLLANGDFEAGSLAPWQASADFVNSTISDSVAYSGLHSLKLVATDGGGGGGDSLYQANIPGLVNGQTYTVSYRYIPHATRALTVRLSGSLLVSTPDGSPSGLRRRLDNSTMSANLTDLRAWFCQRAVGAQGQLMEILLQFLENHFVTQHSKTSDYLDRYYDGSLLDRISASLEYRENKRWREALANPNCTFYDLLKVSAESPAMIIYLDTVGSRADGTRIANENYARELFELFCMGVDNGYDQNDIVAMSRAWTGWTVDIKRAEDVDNPFAQRSTQYGVFPGVGYNAVSNIVGVWTFTYNTNWHGTNRAPILSQWSPTSPATNPVAIGPKVYPARFGPPWAGQSYQLVLPRRTGNAGIQDGYDVIRHLADVAFTQEYISVKLCRLFVHDEFEHGHYDYTDPNRSAEAELVRQCMMAWNTRAADGRKGNIRAVLRTIFNSELFRSHGGAVQKIKTPLEFVASSVRALRSANPDGTFTAFTDGYSFNSPLSRMGVMSLFNRADPDGYPEAGPPWISAGTLAERLRFTQSYLTASTTSGRPNDAGSTFSDPVALLKKKLPSGSWRNAGALADYFLSILFPGEGRANLDLYRASAIAFLNTGDDGVSNSPLSNLADTSTTYDTRIRGMVSLLMTTPRFQEQ